MLMRGHVRLDVTVVDLLDRGFEVVLADRRAPHVLRTEAVARTCFMHSTTAHNDPDRLIVPALTPGRRAFLSHHPVVAAALADSDLLHLEPHP